MDRRVLICILLFRVFLHAHGGSEIIIMTYNVENIFDDVDDGTEYNRYDPGQGNWTAAHFKKKLKSVSDAIKRAVPGGADVISMQEVENLNVLDLLCDDYLVGMGYSYRYLVQAPDQAANCAIISRIPIVRTRAHDPGSWNGSGQRFILEVEIEYRGKPLVLFNNHWKSKSGGTIQTEAARIISSSYLAGRIIDILKDNPFQDILVLGDLNNNVEEYSERDSHYETSLMPLSALPSAGSHGSLFLTDMENRVGLDGDHLVLYEPWYELPEDRRESYLFNGNSGTPDHILIASGLFDKDGFYYEKGNFRVANIGYGYSDHLPLLITLTVAE